MMCNIKNYYLTSLAERLPPLLYKRNTETLRVLYSKTLHCKVIRDALKA
jgi:hypothetical protein